MGGMALGKLTLVLAATDAEWTPFREDPHTEGPLQCLGVTTRTLVGWLPLADDKMGDINRKVKVFSHRYCPGLNFPAMVKARHP
jgi:hypothetical protein